MIIKTHKILLIYLLGFLASCSYEKQDIFFTDFQISLTEPYKKGDTIYFLSNKNDLDTIVVNSIKLYKNDCASLLGPRILLKKIGIKHLPLNHWNSGTESINGEKSHEIPQSIISLDRRGDNTSIFIEYRNFSSKIMNENIGELKLDTIIYNGTKITCYYEIEHGWKKAEKETDILNIIWTIDKGLTAYKLKNGTEYVIINMP